MTDLAARQQQLEESTQQLLGQLDKLAQDAQKSFPEAAKKMKDATEKARKEGLPRNVSEAKKNLAANQGQQALEQENQALNKMKALQESLIQTQSGMKSKQVSVNLEKLLALVRFGLDISKLQEELATVSIPDEMMGDGREFSRGLARSQGHVCRGLESFERDFDALISDEAIFKSSFVSAVSDLLDAAREAADSFEATHVHSGKQLAGASLEKVNRVVAKLIEMVAQLMNQQQQAGMEGFFDQLEKLIEQQSHINEQAERLKQEPSTNPLLQEMMQRMAAEQALVREALEKLAEKYQQAKEVMGDLQGVAGEMKEVEEELKKFGNSDTARQKQKRILYRMLEADKSLHKQGESKKRQARFARDYSPAQVDPVEQQLTEIRQKLFNNLTRESYPVEHRDLVERYLRSIAQ
ncbi:MAG: hypothetical protein HY814_09375 [Candidatus Riflebacteria bacterium]|nr:hypothetical protein [Candidatus Riflebacteria bacterium]